MLSLRPSATRGHFDHGWLDTRHTFSFGDYHDPARMGFRSLRVINEDRVQPGQGFPTHGHRDMEILTYVLAGALEHRDSTGAAGVLRPGDVQCMTAGTGITHSEANGSDREIVHFLQIWILPGRRGLSPAYRQKAFDLGAASAAPLLLASPDGGDGSLTIQQDARVYLLRPGNSRSLEHRLAPGRFAYVQVSRGEVDVNGQPLAAGDGAEVVGESRLVLGPRGAAAEALVFDLG